MGIKIFSVGISEYDELEKITLCEGDATKFAKVVREQLMASQPFTLLNEAVTASSLPRKFSAFCRDLQDSDTLYFYYAGHGCNHENVSYLSAYDSGENTDDIESTWVSLDKLREIARQSKARKILFFIDACQASKKDQRKSMLDDLDVREAIDVENENEFELVFHSCSKGEVALSNSDLGHGVWTYYLINAFSCSEIGKKSLNENYELRASSLQNYLFLNVRDYYLSKGRSFTQKPKSFIMSGIDPLLATFSPEVVEKYSAIPDEHLSKIIYKTIKLEDVDDLPGFIRKPYNRKHHIPNEYNSFTSNFVKKIGDKVIVDIIEHAKEKLIDLFDLVPDEEIENDGYEYYASEDSGTASFKCKYLEYVVSLDLDPEDPSQAIIESELIPFDQNKIYEVREELDDCFTDWFDKMIFTGKEFKMSNLYKKLKKVEKVKPLPFSMSYNSRDENFEITLKSGRRITFYDSRIEVSFRGMEPLDVLLESLTEVSNLLLGIDSSTKLLG